LIFSLLGKFFREDILLQFDKLVVVFRLLVVDELAEREQWLLELLVVRLVGRIRVVKVVSLVDELVKVEL